MVKNSTEKVLYGSGKEHDDVEYKIYVYVNRIEIEVSHPDGREMRGTIFPQNTPTLGIHPGDMNKIDELKAGMMKMIRNPLFSTSLFARDDLR